MKYNLSKIIDFVKQNVNNINIKVPVNQDFVFNKRDLQTGT